MVLIVISGPDPKFVYKVLHWDLNFARPRCASALRVRAFTRSNLRRLKSWMVFVVFQWSRDLKFDYNVFIGISILRVRATRPRVHAFTPRRLIAWMGFGVISDPDLKFVYRVFIVISMLRVRAARPRVHAFKP